MSISDVPLLLPALITERTRLLAFTHVSNVLGVVNPVAELVTMARAVGALVLLDACQSAPHLDVDVKALDVDFAVLSGMTTQGARGALDRLVGDLLERGDASGRNAHYLLRG